MAQGMESGVSDDDSDSPSYEELLELVHEYQKVIKKQSNEIENLNALNGLNAIFATNYENLLCKFKLLSEEHEELNLKIESINDSNHASTSCFDSIDKSDPCNEKCFENVVVESCDDLIAKENDELKQEVERLMKNLYRLKGKGIKSNVHLRKITVKTW